MIFYIEDKLLVYYIPLTNKKVNINIRFESTDKVDNEDYQNIFNIIEYCLNGYKDKRPLGSNEIISDSFNKYPTFLPYPDRDMSELENNNKR